MYETQVMTDSKCKAFIEAFQEQVGTDYELNTDTERTVLTEGTASVMCMDLEGDEVQICRDIENSL